MTDAAWASLRKDGWIEHHGLRLGATFFDTLPREDVPGRLAKTAAPLLIYHGMADRDVPFEQGRAYESALRYAGAEVEFRPLDTSDHAMRSVTATDSILTGSERWLCRHLT
jgi:acetyl esterase/lipase